jgi:hypothetical protein
MDGSHGICFITAGGGDPVTAGQPVTLEPRSCSRLRFARGGADVLAAETCRHGGRRSIYAWAKTSCTLTSSTVTDIEALRTC